MENKNTITYLNSKIWYRLIKVLYGLLFIGTIVTGIIFITEKIGVGRIDPEKTKVICYSPNDRFFLSPEKHFNMSLKTLGIPSIYKYSILNSGLFEYKLNYSRYIIEDSENAGKIIIYCMNKINKDITDYKIRSVSDYNDEDGNQNYKKTVLILQKGYELNFGKNSIFSNKKTEENLNNEEKGLFEKKMSDYEEGSFKPYNIPSKLKGLDFSVQMFDIKPKYSYIEYILLLTGMLLGIFITFEFIRRSFYYVMTGSFFPKKETH